MAKQINLAQVGIGNWGKNLLRNFNNLALAKVKIICDKNPDVLQRVKNEYTDIDVTDNIDDILKRSDIDAAIITTQPDTHYHYAKKFLEQNKHVFVEKPMVLDSAHGEEMVRLAKERGLILMVGHILEYHPAFVKVKEYVTSGELGDIHYIYTSRVNLGIVRQNENSLWSFAPHDISVVLMLMDSEPETVVSTGQAFLQPGIEDVVFTTLHFADKKMAHLHVSWLDPHKIRKVTVVGSKKMVVIDDMETSEKIRIYDKGVNFTGNYTQYGEYLTLRIGDIHIPSVKNQEPLRVECQAFIDAINSGKPPVSDGNDGLQVVKVLTAAQESLKQGGVPVRI
ncbi:Gfo/Idh/MocA family oxidoreductase [candidate division KSB1 bacterium]|nr:Gfo/Idh/MocA family oxidoreductase [candidate division KSB1 bacterium]